MGTLRDLEKRLARDLAYLDYAAVPWLRPHAAAAVGRVFDVVIQGGGMQGLSIAHLLRREQVDNVLVLDENPPGREGPWVTYARMHYLRTPKDFVGPDLGMRALSYREWFDATHGTGAWDRLDRVPTDSWMEYLCWYRAVLRLPVQNETRLTLVEPGPQGLLRLSLACGDVREVVHSRLLVRATGILGSGGAAVPRCIRDGLPAERWAHTSDRIDFGALKGRRVAVIGAGASAFDNAATALESGACSVRMLMRRAALPTVKVTSAMSFPGFLRHFADLDDARRWRIMEHSQHFSAPAPPESVKRASQLPGYSLHPGTGLRAARLVGDTVALETTAGPMEVDFVICGTGFTTDLRLRPELKCAVGHIALWNDRYTPPDELRNAALARFPYLGSGFEFVEKTPGAAPWISRIREYGFGSMPSMGPICVGLNGMTFGAERLLRSITRDLFTEAAAHHLEDIERLAEP